MAFPARVLTPKCFRMTDQYVVSPSTGVAHRYIFELRYDFGFLYWDRVGRLACELSTHEGWDVESMNADRCVRNAEKNIRFAYGPKKLDFAQTQTEDVVELLEAHEFAALAEQFSGDVLEALDQPFCTRIGFRFQELFGIMLRGGVNVFQDLE